MQKYKPKKNSVSWDITYAQRWGMRKNYIFVMDTTGGGWGKGEKDSVLIIIEKKVLENLFLHAIIGKGKKGNL